jgi:hypothetical protein
MGKRMADIFIDGQGFSIGRWYFPPFSLRRGECISLRLPKEAVVDEERIIRCLTGSESVPGLNLNARVLFAKSAAAPSGWRRWFQDPTPFVWLQRNTTLSEDAIRSILLEHRIDQMIPLSHHAGTPRMLLGLEKAYAMRPEGVVFSTSGLDPLGVRDVFRIVAESLPECSAIYLAWPSLCQGREQHFEFAGASGIAVIDKHRPVLAR